MIKIERQDKKKRENMIKIFLNFHVYMHVKEMKFCFNS